jgi:Flp pilus assembly protein TadD
MSLFSKEADMRIVTFVSILAGSLVAAALGSAQMVEKAPVEKKADWTGRRVMSPKDEVLAVVKTFLCEKNSCDKDGKQITELVPVPATVMMLSMTVFLVREDDGTNLKVRTPDYGEVSILKERMVPIEEADAPLGMAIQKNPKSVRLRRTRARVRQLNGDLDGAVGDLVAAAALDPASPGILHQRALVHIDREDFENALRDLNEAAEIATEDAAILCARAGVRVRTRRFADAVADYENALPHDGRRGTARNGLAWLLATCSDANVRDGRRAVTLAEDAVEGSKRKNASYLDTLAAAYAEAGRFDDAVRVQQEALGDREFHLSSGNAANERLEMYRQRKAYREK